MLLTEDSTVVGAFRSWVENLSEDGQPLKFYIDGINEYLTVIADGVEEVKSENPRNSKAVEGIFDLSGRQIADRKSTSRRLQKGIYIINGKKVAIKE